MHSSVLVLATAMLTRYGGFSPTDIENYMAGLIDGLIQKDDLKYLQQCMQDTQALSFELNDALNKISKFDTADITAGITELGQMMAQMPKDLEHCTEMQADILRIERWAYPFMWPQYLIPTITINVIKNYQILVKDITDLDKALAIDDMKTVGKDVASIMIDVFGPVPPQQPSDVDEIAFTEW